MATVYRVTGNYAGALNRVAFAPSQGAASKLRRELAEQHGLRPLKDLDIEPIDIPTTKAGVIEWLNAQDFCVSEQ